MKKNFWIVFLATISLSFYSCEKEQNLTPNPTYNPNATGDNPTPAGGGSTSSGGQFMKATINGVVTNFPLCDADTFGFFVTEFDITGYFDAFSFKAGEQQYINLEILDDDYVIKADTTYSLSSSEFFRAKYDENVNILSDSTFYSSETGQLRFSKATPSGYEGTFSFSGKSEDDKKTVTVTNGSFKAVIKKQ